MQASRTHPSGPKTPFCTTFTARLKSLRKECLVGKLFGFPETVLSGEAQRQIPLTVGYQESLLLAMG